ncbi:MAG: DNA polymerase III subunit [Woeseiaceae bacterium]|nr:DNA polymerase III subunit [Gammaproteobacteria bacterium]NNK25112.1 DNA polymerase III subunit [Woeseiaceae bacterium]
MELPWLKYFVDAWHDRVTRARVPHAVLLAGPVGVGKRAAARWLAGETLGIGHAAFPEHPQAIPEHADLRWLRPPEDKASIGIEQVRELVGEFGLTSYEGGRKVAVIEPADTMTINAANSLLKTLEEPPGDALLILVADRVGKLPATIFSRCQRIDMAPPTEADAMAWLDRLQPGAPWAQALHAVGGAPLAAIEAIEELDTGAAMARDLNALGQGQASAVEVSARWSKMAPAFVFEWLARQLKLAIIAVSAGRESAAGLAIDDSVLRRMDTRNLFCYLDIINGLRAQPPGSYNVLLTLEGLLIDWAEGLQACTNDAPIDGINLMLAGGRQ